MPKKKSEHYVNNKELLESLIVYRSKVDKAAQKYFEKYDTYPPSLVPGKENREYLIILENVS
jgi:hypothetical protein